MNDKTLLELTCPSDWDGRQLPEGGFIGLRKIAFNGTYWEGLTQLGALAIPDGGHLIIRREGNRILIARD